MQGRAEAPAHVESKENRVEEEEEEEEEDEEDENVEEENDEEEFTLYCYCQKQSWKVDDDDTVQCGGCGELYHFECLRKVGCAVDPTAAARGQWFCPSEDCEVQRQREAAKEDEDKEEEEQEVDEDGKIATQCTSRSCRKWRDVKYQMLARKERAAASSGLPRYKYVCADSRHSCGGTCQHCKAKECGCKCNLCSKVGISCSCPAFEDDEDD